MGTHEFGHSMSNGVRITWRPLPPQKKKWERWGTSLRIEACLTQRNTPLPGCVTCPTWSCRSNRMNPKILAVLRPNPLGYGSYTCLTRTNWPNMCYRRLPNLVAVGQKYRGPKIFEAMDQSRSFGQSVADFCNHGPPQGQIWSFHETVVA